MFGPVFSRVIVCTAFERSGCSIVARSVPALQRLVDPGGMQREVLADAARVDGDPGVLADEVLLVVGDLDVLRIVSSTRWPGTEVSRSAAAASASRRSCGMSFSAQT